MINIFLLQFLSFTFFYLIISNPITFYLILFYSILFYFTDFYLNLFQLAFINFFKNK